MTDMKIFCFDLQITQYIAAVPFDKNIKKAIFIVAQVKTQNVLECEKIQNSHFVKKPVRENGKR